MPDTDTNRTQNEVILLHYMAQAAWHLTWAMDKCPAPRPTGDAATAISAAIDSLYRGIRRVTEE